MDIWMALQPALIGALKVLLLLLVTLLIGYVVRFVRRKTDLALTREQMRDMEDLARAAIIGTEQRLGSATDEMAEDAREHLNRQKKTSAVESVVQQAAERGIDIAWDTASDLVHWQLGRLRKVLPG